jgi:hypothetical protein
MIFGEFVVGLNYPNAVHGKSHLHVGLPLWFLAHNLVCVVNWKCSEECKQCFTASSQQTVYISQSFPGGETETISLCYDNIKL